MNKHQGSTLDSLFEELGELEEVYASSAKKILAIQAERRMVELGLTTTALATLMRTSRNQVHRILDQEDAGITLKMLFRLSQALDLPLRLGFEIPNVGVKAASRRAATKRARPRTRTKSAGGTTARA